ncbi:MAG: flagellar export chaperone FliS [Clostridia bacterium]|nr:flagellar export chaperone FliS [Clostridia bacterium]
MTRGERHSWIQGPAGQERHARVMIRMMATPYNRYLETQVQTAPPENLVLMLYDGAIRFANQAKLDLAEGKRESAHKNLTRGQDILSELMGSLNMDAGDIAVNLFKLYEYMQYRLVQANVQRSIEPIDEVVRMLGELRETWFEAIRDYRGKIARAGGQ